MRRSRPWLRELLALDHVQPIVYEPGLAGIDEEGLDRRQHANLEALRDAAGRVVEGATRRLHLLVLGATCTDRERGPRRSDRGGGDAAG